MENQTSFRILVFLGGEGGCAQPSGKIEFIADERWPVSFPFFFDRGSLKDF
jgi:hypothetical protein